MLRTVVAVFCLCVGSSCAFGQGGNSDRPYSAVKGSDELVLSNPEGNPLVTYRYTVKSPPPGVDAAYGRAGYIHPLQTISGKVLTHIQPPDHYHHYGLWNPWTHVEYKGEMYDLWNIGDKKGTVRFVKFNDIFEDREHAGFEAVHEHVIFDAGQETVIMRENWRIVISQLDANSYAVDIRSTLVPMTDAPVVLKEYRYGGLGFRATPEWTNKNSDVLTSTGKTRKDADGSLERWTIMSGQLGESRGGVLFLSHPDNYNFPEPVRIWPVDANGGRGDQFFNFSPTKNMDWLLEAGKTYTLQYRLVVFDGSLQAEEAERLWQSFAN
ncbi:PmoA family protein [Parapedobacter sp. 10938]|uniref:DUF6807 domain-containing protein n=1 Tax=Parapedobacter flavus TaxID=3110225 RepID=UPI002DB9D0A2|nr:PmoA family protein [Parapedobacter sp. 10938]MEC3881049.1 PmoA family protein [Parapedobacter sp. 10938]